MKSSGKCHREHFFFMFFAKVAVRVSLFFIIFTGCAIVCIITSLIWQSINANSVYFFFFFLNITWSHEPSWWLPPVSNHFSLCFHEIVNVLLVPLSVQSQEDFSNNQHGILWNRFCHSRSCECFLGKFGLPILKLRKHSNHS